MATRPAALPFASPTSPLPLTAYIYTAHNSPPSRPAPLHHHTVYCIDAHRPREPLRLPPRMSTSDATPSRFLAVHLHHLPRLCESAVCVGLEDGGRISNAGNDTKPPSDIVGRQEDNKQRRLGPCKNPTGLDPCTHSSTLKYRQ